MPREINTRRGDQPRPVPQAASELFGHDVPESIKIFRKEVHAEHPAVGRALDQHPWAYQPLEQFGKVAPQDLQSSLRAGDISDLMVDDINTRVPDNKFTPEDKDKIIVSAVVADASRGELHPDVLYNVFTSGRRWRDDPHAPEWEVVHGHAEASAQIVENAGGDPAIKKMTGGHHTLKRVGPYGIPVNDEDSLAKRGTEIIAAADVAEAVSKKFTGEGRKYLNDEEFAGRQLAEIVTTELNVDPVIAEIAAKRTLEVKGLANIPHPTTE